MDTRPRKIDAINNSLGEKALDFPYKVIPLDGTHDCKVKIQFNPGTAFGNLNGIECNGRNVTTYQLFYYADPDEVQCSDSASAVDLIKRESDCFRKVRLGLAHDEWINAA